MVYKIYYRKLNDAYQELEVYDLIGMEYYYMNNIGKAQFYHNRMMEGELEPFSLVKQKNLEVLEKKDLKRRELKELKVRKTETIFEDYNRFVETHPNDENIVLPHENKGELLR